MVHLALPSPRYGQVERTAGMDHSAVLRFPAAKPQFRTGFACQYNGLAYHIWIYDNGKAHELIPERHLEEM